MTRWYLIVAIMFAAGCEQLRSPQRITELEDRINKLTTEVVALKAKPAKPAPPDEHAGSGSAGDPPPGPAGAGSAAGSGAQDGSGRAAAVEPTANDAGTSGDAGQADAGREDAAHGDARPGDTRHDDPRGDDQRDDAAMHRLLALVSSSTSKPRPGGAADKQPRPGEAADRPRPGEAADTPTAPAGPRWAYDGKTGPPTWGTLDPAWRACLMGSAQSPIDIVPAAGAATPIVFHYRPTAAAVIDDGRSLQVNLAPGSSIELDDVLYELLEVHLHAPSEHTIAGEHYPLEVQLVHKDATGKLAVIGILYDVGAESKALAGLWAPWPHKADVEDKLKKPFDPSLLLPDTRTVYRYTGSLTTPPCTEGVLWNVLRRTPSDSKAHLEMFGLHFRPNARDVQPLGDRKIQ